MNTSGTRQDDIARFIRARLAEIEIPDWHTRDCQTHRLMPPGSPLGLGGSPMSCNCGVPTLAMRTTEAMTRIVDLHVPSDGTLGLYCTECSSLDLAGDPDPDWPCETVRALASAWRDHPDCRPEWVLARAV